MLALGEETSHVLFDNGEVEAWGKVSNRKWRTHIKEDLGGNTPQALVSGYNHQCIILENAGQNHGSLMCWGENGNGRLGVGDTNPRTIPTAVTVAVLGHTGRRDDPQYGQVRGVGRRAYLRTFKRRYRCVLGAEQSRADRRAVLPVPTKQ